MVQTDLGLNKMKALVHHVHKDHKRPASTQAVSQAASIVDRGRRRSWEQTEREIGDSPTVTMATGTARSPDKRQQISP
nr:hypothetical protein BaRGS_015557 [Batillaria attramentaria]